MTITIPLVGPLAETSSKGVTFIGEYPDHRRLQWLTRWAPVVGLVCSGDDAAVALPDAGWCLEIALVEEPSREPESVLVVTVWVTDAGLRDCQSGQRACHESQPYSLVYSPIR